MANFSKAFNFRGGLQVDEDVLVVRGANVGIGSTIPNERLVVGGNIVARSIFASDSGVSSIPNINATGVITAKEFTDGIVSIQSGIVTDKTGIVTYYGDGRFLQGLPTSQWLDVDVGLGFTSIYAAGFVGVATDDPRFAFQVGGAPFADIGPILPPQDGVGIDNSGNIFASGNISATGIISTVDSGEFLGKGTLITAISANNITVGSLSENIYGNIIRTNEVIAQRFTGIASTAVNLDANANIRVNSILSPTINAETKFISTDGYVSIGDEIPGGTPADIETTKFGGEIGETASIFAISESGTSRIFIGTERPNNSERGFGGIERENATTNLELVNYDVGNIDYILHKGSGGQGATEGSFRWIYGQDSRILTTLSADGTLSLNGNGSGSVPSFSVIGIGTIFGDYFVQGELSVIGNILANSSLTITNNLTVNELATFNNVTVTGNLQLDGTISLPDDIAISTLEASTSVLVGDEISANINISPTEININGTTLLNAAQVTSPTISGTTGSFGSISATTTGITFSGGNLTNGNSSFSVNQAGNIVSPSGTLSIGVATISQLDCNDFNGTFNSIISTTENATFEDILINGTLTIGVQGNIAPIANLEVGNNLTADSLNLSGIATISTLNIVNPLSNNGSTIELRTDIEGTALENITGIDGIQGEIITANQRIVTPFVEFPGLNDNVRMEVGQLLGPGGPTGVATGVRFTFSSDQFPNGGIIEFELIPTPPTP